MTTPLPDDLVDLLDDGYGGNREFNSRAFTSALRFISLGLSEDQYVDYVSVSGVAACYPRRDLLRRLRKTYAEAEDKHDPTLASVVRVDPKLAGELQAMRDAIEAVPEVKNRTVLLALIRHAVNTGHNPVNASARQLAAISGKSVPVTARAMNRLHNHPALLAVTYDGEYGHSRLWHLHTCWRPKEGYICTCKNICNPLADPRGRFREWVEALDHGTKLTVTAVAAELSVTRPRARKLLEDHQDEFFGGGFFPGDRRTRRPATWWVEGPAHWWEDEQQPSTPTDPPTPVHTGGTEETTTPNREEQLKNDHDNRND